MDKTKGTWWWPVVCGVSTAVGLVIGLIGEGPVDVVGALVLTTPLWLLLTKTRFLGTRGDADR